MISPTGNKSFLVGIRKRISYKEAFLLFEVMVAVAILAFGLTYASGSFITALRGLMSSQSYNKALSLLEEKLCEIERIAIKEGEIVEGKDGGKFKENENFRWELESKRDEDLPLNELRLKVYWLDRGRERNISVVTYLMSE